MAKALITSLTWWQPVLHLAFSNICEGRKPHECSSLHDLGLHRIAKLGNVLLKRELSKADEINDVRERQKLNALPP
jgi:hypothetical protein